jgi:redox-sensitive bicupin YhaK (pirin superfamily)
METKKKGNKMKTVIHKRDSRGKANHGWLQANHSFSFANYFDKDKMQFGALRVLNDDIIAPKMGFGTHPHDNMEIITIPLSGSLKHRDNMKDAWQAIEAGEVQIMSAGTGVAHSEINGSNDDHLNLFQIWIIPNKRNVKPRYDQKRFDKSERQNTLQTVVSSIDKPVDGSLLIHQDAKISRLDMSKGNTYDYEVSGSNQGVYIMTIHGSISVGAEVLQQRDAIGITEADTFAITSKEDSELLLIEVPMS